jgi:hypothetical protein
MLITHHGCILLTYSSLLDWKVLGRSRGHLLTRQVLLELDTMLAENCVMDGWMSPNHHTLPVSVRGAGCQVGPDFTLGSAQDGSLAQ